MCQVGGDEESEVTPCPRTELAAPSSRGQRESTAAPLPSTSPPSPRGSPVLGSVGLSPPSESSGSSALGSSPCSMRVRRSGFEMAASACQRETQNIPLALVAEGGSPTFAHQLPRLPGMTANGKRGSGGCSPPVCSAHLVGAWTVSGLQEHTRLR